MAKISDVYPPGHWHMYKGRDFICVEVDDRGRPVEVETCGSWSERSEKEDASMDALPADRVWSTPVADDQARYYIVSKRPFVLAHIPYLDGYQAHPALLRGLRLKDVQREKDAWSALMTHLNAQEA